MRVKNDLVGKRFERLLVVEYSHKAKDRHSVWSCLCDCGNVCYVASNKLTTGYVKSCGCLFREAVTKHGQSQSKNEYNRIYRIYKNMITRCYDSNNKDYKYYGEVGVIICDLWKNSFPEFLKWSIENGYKSHLTIDRINPYGNYDPNNCRWATHKEQANNKRKNKLNQDESETNND